MLLIIFAVACLLGAVVLGRRYLQLGRGLSVLFEGFFPSVFAGSAIITSGMSPRRKRIVLVAGLALCLMPVLMREPLHKGKPVGYWVDGACSGYDSNESWQFRQEVKDMGPSAMPYVLKRLRPSENWRNTYRSLRTYLPSRLQELCPDVLSVAAIEDQCYGAARTLALFGADAKPAVGALVRLLPGTKYPVTGVVIHALTAIGTDARAALPALHSMLTNRDATLAVDTAEALWAIGWETNKVLEICTNVMASPGDAYAESKAGFLLSRLLTAAAPAVPFALNALRDTNQQVGTRANAAMVLGAARVSTPEIRAALLEGTQSGQEVSLRSFCAMALWRLDSQYAPLATRLVLENIVALKGQFPLNEQDFSKWLEARDLDPKLSIPTLKELLDSDSSEMREEAAEAFKQIDPEAAAKVGVK